MRHTLAIITASLASFIACNPSPTHTPAAPPAATVSAAPPASVPAPPPAGAQPANLAACHLEVQRFASTTKATWGSVRPGLFLTSQRNALQVWYPGGHREPYFTAALSPDGKLGAASKVAPFDGLGEAGFPQIAAGHGLTVAVDNVYVANQEADIFLSINQGNDRFGKPVQVSVGNGFDTAPIAAVGPRHIAVAWGHGTYPSASNIAFALLDHQGRQLNAAVIERDAEPEGITLVAVPRGFVLIYAVSSAASYKRQQLVSLLIDPGGHVIGRHIVHQGSTIWPTAHSNGKEIGVAARVRVQDDDTKRSRGAVGFFRLDLSGKPISTKPMVADSHDDPIASFRPHRLLSDKDGWWLADTASFSASVIIARASESRVVRLDKEGRRKSSVVVSEMKGGGTLASIMQSGNRVLGAYIEDRGERRLRPFTVRCGKPSPPKVAGKCDPRQEPIAKDRFGALASFVEGAIETEGDLVVGYRPMVQGRYGPEAGNVHVARLRPSGAAAWTTDLGKGYHPQLAAGHGRIAIVIKTGDGSPQSIALLNSTTGAIEIRKKLTPNTGDHCITAIPKGWLVARGSAYGKRGPGSVLVLDKQAAVSSLQKLDDDLNGCGLLADDTGVLLAYTHVGMMSETNYLFVRRLDHTGQLQGSSRRIPKVHFARHPRLTWRNKRALMLFSGPLERRLSGVAIDAHGEPLSAVETIAETYGLSSYALWGDEVTWSTSKQLSRRGCLDKLFASKP